ncbi:MAG: amt 1 [Bacteroidetes bacterium]|nr:amt 1 [Bacteroidota bacterium]
MRPFWALSFAILLVVAIAGSIFPYPSTDHGGGPVNPADVAWMLTATGLVLLMTPGLSYFYGGMVSAKNVISTMLQSFIAMAVVSILWVVVGFSLAFGDSIGGLVGNPLTFLMFRGVGTATHPTLSPTIPLLLLAMFQLKFAIITPALITGSFAERVRFSSYLVFMVLFSLLIYAPLAHMTWHPDGFLRKMGVLDFAGGAVVHMSAGFAALAGAMYLGRRESHKNGTKHKPANIPYVLLGTGLLWFGWFGFNAGSALGANESAVLAFATTNTASAAAALAWVFYDAMRGRKASALGASVGAVVGLVAITPAAGYVSIGASIAIGTIASLISNVAVSWKASSNLDDTLDVFPCHGLGGFVGMFATAVFAKDTGLIFGETALFWAHLKGLVFVSAFTFLGSWLLYRVTNLLIPVRVAREQEQVGLDLSQHGEATA